MTGVPSDEAHTFLSGFFFWFPPPLFFFYIKNLVIFHFFSFFARAWYWVLFKKLSYHSSLGIGSRTDFSAGMRQSIYILNIETSIKLVQGWCHLYYPYIAAINHKGLGTCPNGWTLKLYWVLRSLLHHLPTK